MNTLFYVRYVPWVMLVDTMEMTPDVELAHRRLCDWVWVHGECPTDNAVLLQGITKAPAAEWARVSEMLSAKGWCAQEGRLTHDGVMRTLIEAKEAHASAVSRGLMGAKAKLSAGSAKADAGAEPKQLPLKKPLKVQGTILSVKTDERLTFNSSAQQKDGDGENEFLAELRETLERHDKAKARRELATWGGWWRNRYRENAAKARRVLGELKSMILEQRIKRNPGAAAKDLWGRFP